MKHIFTKIKNMLMEDATRETKWLTPLSRHLLLFTIAAVFLLISVMCERELNAFEAQTEQYEQLSIYEKVRTAGPATIQEISGYKTLKWLSFSLALILGIHAAFMQAVVTTIEIKRHIKHKSQIKQKKE